MELGLDYGWLDCYVSTELLYLWSCVNTVHGILVWIGVNDSLDHLFIFQGPFNQSPQRLATSTQSCLHGKKEIIMINILVVIKDFVFVL